VQSIDSLNQLPHDDFAAAIGPLFETAPPLADALYAARPFASFEALIDTAESLAGAMSFDDQVTVLNAHPRIGANPASVSAASYREQGYDTECVRDRAELEGVYARLAQLNAAYETLFGFRFVVFVNKRPRAEILQVLQQRIINTREAELAEGLYAMFQIARDRLHSQVT
jgi:OHCU decarboxylase